MIRVYPGIRRGPFRIEERGRPMADATINVTRGGDVVAVPAELVSAFEREGYKKMTKSESASAAKDARKEETK